MIDRPQRAMQGGNVEGAAQQRMEGAVRDLIAATRAAMAEHTLDADFLGQEMASLIMQAVICEVDDPTAFLEGAITQLGWQLGARSSDAGRQQNFRAAEQWLANGFKAALAEPVAQPAAGRA